MTAPVCKTCDNPKCGNHAACARRKKEQKTWELVMVWNVVWLYIGANVFLEAMYAIDGDETREFVMNSFLDDMSLLQTLFLVRICADDRDGSWAVARELLPGLPE